MLSELNPILNHLDHLPRMLYKYRIFDKDGFALSMAADGEAFFASPRSFNDPFDCYFIPRGGLYRGDPHAVRRRLKTVVNNHLPDASREERRRFERFLRKKVSEMRADPTSRADALIQSQHDNTGILSLTARRDSAAMWAYYAGNHTGLCIGLLMSILGQRQAQMLAKNDAFSLAKVAYKDEVPQADITPPESGPLPEERVDEFSRTFYTKSTDWAHEDEYRLIYVGHSNVKFQFGAPTIGEVIVGQDVAKSDVETLCRSLQASNSDAVVLRAIRRTDTFGFDFEELT